MRLPSRTLTTLTASIAALGFVTGCTAPDSTVEVQSSTGTVAAQETQTAADAAPAAPSPSPSAASSSPASAGSAGDTVVRRLTVDGDSNTIGVQSTEEIDVDGSQNSITYAEGEPRVDLDDDDAVTNSITRG